jgi:hypothetical protein
VLSEPDYLVDHEARRVRSNGEIKWRGELVAGEPVAFGACHLSSQKANELATLERHGVAPLSDTISHRERG